MINNRIIIALVGSLKPYLRSYILYFYTFFYPSPPCRQSIPHLTEIAHKYQDKGVVFVGITDEDEKVNSQK